MQWRAALARSEESLFVVAQRIAQEHKDAKVGAYLDVDIVAPPAHFDSLIAAYERKEKLVNFRQEVCWRLKEALQAGHSLPPLFSLCPEEEHYDCEGCTQGIRASISKEELYERYAKAWPKDKRPQKSLVDSKFVPSRAPVAKEREPLSFARADFGHHSHGILLEEVPPNIELGPYRPTFLTGALFFYHVIEAKSTHPLQAIFDDVHRKEEEQKKAIEEGRRAAYRREKEERIQAVLAVFRPG
jgi:hypothetical protein